MIGWITIGEAARRVLELLEQRRRESGHAARCVAKMNGNEINGRDAANASEAVPRDMGKRSDAVKRRPSLKPANKGSRRTTGLFGHVGCTLNSGERLFPSNIRQPFPVRRFHHSIAWLSLDASSLSYDICVSQSFSTGVAFQLICPMRRSS